MPGSCLGVCVILSPSVRVLCWCMCDVPGHVRMPAYCHLSSLPPCTPCTWCGKFRNHHTHTTLESDTRNKQLKARTSATLHPVTPVGTDNQLGWTNSAYQDPHLTNSCSQKHTANPLTCVPTRYSNIGTPHARIMLHLLDWNTTSASKRSSRGIPLNQTACYIFTQIIAPQHAPSVVTLFLWF